MSGTCSRICRKITVDDKLCSCGKCTPTYLPASGLAEPLHPVSSDQRFTAETFEQFGTPKSTDGWVKPKGTCDLCRTRPATHWFGDTSLALCDDIACEAANRTNFERD
jgi:hypothetical protein